MQLRKLGKTGLDVSILGLGASPTSNDSSKWNKNTSRNCDDDISSKKFSLYCTLQTASEEVVGTWDNDPFRTAIRLVLLTIKKYENRRVIGILI